jgi:hypothetical protein
LGQTLHPSGGGGIASFADCNILSTEAMVILKCFFQALYRMRQHGHENFFCKFDMPQFSIRTTSLVWEVAHNELEAY